MLTNSNDETFKKRCRYLRNEFHFSGVHGAMNRSGSKCKVNEPRRGSCKLHVSFASDPLRFIAP